MILSRHPLCYFARNDELQGMARQNGKMTHFDFCPTLLAFVFFFGGLRVTLKAWHPARVLKQHGKQHTLNQVCMLGAAGNQLAGAGAR